MKVLLFLSLLTAPAFADTESLDSGFTKIEELKSEFQEKTGHHVGCWIQSVDQCIEGLEKALLLASEQIFPNTNFDSIYIDQSFRDTGSSGWLIIDHRASVDEIKTFLVGQKNRLGKLKQLKSTFYEQSTHYAGCWIAKIDECITGYEKLVELSATNIFPNSNFDAVYVDVQFKNVNASGFVVIDHRGTTGEIAAFLERQ